MPQPIDSFPTIVTSAQVDRVIADTVGDGVEGLEFLDNGTLENQDLVGGAFQRHLVPVEFTQAGS